MDSEILVVENLCKTYKTKKGVLSVLDNLNLKFGKGIIAILGANGAGKKGHDRLAAYAAINLNYNVL